MALIVSERTYVDVVDEDGHRFDLVDIGVEIPRGWTRGALSFPSLVLRWSTEGTPFADSACGVFSGRMRFVQRREHARADVAETLEASR